MPVRLFVCQKVGKYEHIYQKRSKYTFDRAIISEILQKISLRLFHYEGGRSTRMHPWPTILHVGRLWPSHLKTFGLVKRVSNNLDNISIKLEILFIFILTIFAYFS